MKIALFVCLAMIMISLPQYTRGFATGTLPTKIDSSTVGTLFKFFRNGFYLPDLKMTSKKLKKCQHENPSNN